MTIEEKEILKKNILEQIIEFEEEIKQLEEAAKPISPDSAYGRISRMDAINNKAIVEASLSDKKTTLQRFHYSLDKLDNNEFGKCVKCGVEIPFKRLISLTYADLCISCSAKYR